MSSLGGSFSFGRRTGGGFEVATVAEAQRLEKEKIAQRKERERLLQEELAQWELARRLEDERIAAELSKERRRSAASSPPQPQDEPCQASTSSELPSLPPRSASRNERHRKMSPPAVLKSIASDETDTAIQKREQQQARRLVCKNFGFPEVWVSAQTAKSIEKINNEVQNAAYNVGCAKVFTPSALRSFEEMGLPCLSDKMLAPAIQEVVRQQQQPPPSRGEESKARAASSVPRRTRRVTMMAQDSDDDADHDEEETKREDHHPKDHASLLSSQSAPPLTSAAGSQITSADAEGLAPAPAGVEPVTIEQLVLPPDAVTSIDIKRPPVAIDAASVLKNVLYFASFGTRSTAATGTGRPPHHGNKKINEALTSLLGLAPLDEVPSGPSEGTEVVRDPQDTPVVELTQHLFWFVFASFFHHRVLPSVVTQAFPRMAEAFARIHLAAANIRLSSSHGMVFEQQSVGASPIDYVCCSLVHAVCLAFVVIFPKNHNLFTVDFCNRACSLMFLALLGRDTDADYWENNRRLHFSHPSISIDDVAGAATLAAARLEAQRARDEADEEMLVQWQKRREGRQHEQSAPAYDTPQKAPPTAKKATKPMTLIVFGKVHNLAEGSDEIFDVDFGRMSMIEERQRRAADAATSSHKKFGATASGPAVNGAELALSMEGRKHLANEEAKSRFSPSSYGSDVMLAHHIHTINVQALERAAATAKARGGGIVDRRATRLRSVATTHNKPDVSPPRDHEDASVTGNGDQEEANVDASAFHIQLEAKAVVCAVAAEEMVRGFKRIVDTERLRSNSLRRFRSSASFSREDDFRQSAGDRSALADLHREQRSIFDVPALTTEFRATNVDDIVKERRRRIVQGDLSRPGTAADPEVELMTAASRKAHQRDHRRSSAKSGRPEDHANFNAVVDDPFEKFGDVLFGETAVSGVFSTEVSEIDEDDAKSLVVVAPKDDEVCAAVNEIVDCIFPPPKQIAPTGNATQQVLFKGKLMNTSSSSTGKSALGGDKDHAKLLISGGDVRTSFLTLKRHESISYHPSQENHRHQSFLHRSQTPGGLLGDGGTNGVEIHDGRRSSSAMQQQQLTFTRRDTMRTLFDALHSDAQVKTQEFTTKVEAKPDGSLVQKVEASQITPGMSAALRYRHNRKSPTSSLWLNMTKACNTTIKKIQVATKVHESTAVRDAMLAEEIKRKQAAAAQQYETVIHRYHVEKAQLDSIMDDPLKRTDLVNKWIEDEPPRQRVDRYRHAQYFAGSALSEEAKLTALSVQEGFRRVETVLTKHKKAR